MSHELFPIARKFKVMDFDPFISDVHNAIAFNIIQTDLNAPFTLDYAMCNNENQSYTCATWNNNSINDFKSNIDAE